MNDTLFFFLNFRKIWRFVSLLLGFLLFFLIVPCSQAEEALLILRPEAAAEEDRVGLTGSSLIVFSSLLV
jgi:hypothetical protein